MVGILWSSIAGFLYGEIAVAAILLIPFISPQRSNSFIAQPIENVAVLLLVDWNRLLFNIEVYLFTLDIIMTGLIWTSIAGFMYLEVFVSVLLLIPFISPSRWQKIFRSNLVTKLQSYAHIYFNVFILILSLVFIESIREMRKYNNPLDEVDLKNNRESVLAAQVKLFRAQRNFYICGFALFMWFILKRLVTQTSRQALLEAECEASQKQAKQANAAAQQLLDQADNTSNKKREDQTEEEKSTAQQLDKTKEDLVKTKMELKKALNDLDALRKQAEGTNREYDRLLKEHSKLQEASGETSSKKE